MNQKSSSVRPEATRASSSTLAAALQAARNRLALGGPAFATLPSQAERPMGVALIASPDLRGGRAYLCAPEEHRIHVLNQDYRPLFSFGGHGSAPGLFDTPSDVAIVWIDEAIQSERTADTAVLVVADRGNSRIQLCELDGAPICALGGPVGGVAPTGRPSRAGYPFFRLNSPAPLPSPSRLEWRPPYLDVLCTGNVVVRVDLAAALLPDFATWVNEASASDLRMALRRFALHGHRSDVPASCLVEIVERLQPSRRRGVTLPWKARA